MSRQQQSASSVSSRSSRNSARIVAQTTVDARLDADFEEHGTSFDYSQTVKLHRGGGADLDLVNTTHNNSIHDQGTATTSRRSEKVTAYLQQIQRGKLIQPFGCLVAIDDRTMKVVAYSENAPDMLTSVTHAVPSVGDHGGLSFGSDLRSVFTSPSVAALHKAFAFGDVSLLNPVLVHCRGSGRPFYAVLHRVTGCLVADLEPVKPSELPMTAAGALQSYKLAAKAISRLQSLPGGSLRRLCDAVCQEVLELTGYDRVMAYRFHDDDHGEVFAEVTKPGLEPYQGLHYPATDIPQAARFLFMKNKVRMICDCRVRPVRVLQDSSLPSDLTFCGSTLRAPHSCHLQYMENMGSIASLVMAVVVNEDEEESEDASSQQQQQQHKSRKKLWGLVVCHHTSPRFVPFPLRYACEFLAQVFAIHVGKELELEQQAREKTILRTQTVLCDMLLRDAPLGIVSRSPSIMDLVRCDGAALLYQNRVFRLGTAPSEANIRILADWLADHHMDSTGLSTDSLADAGFPGAAALGDEVCGMAAARISAGDVLFWFRSHTAAEIRWGGAKHEAGERDDGRRMHPRSSFKAFLEVVKTRSLPWKDYEMDAIHSLQLILRGAFADGNGVGRRKQAPAPIDSRIGELRLDGMAELQALTNEMVRLIETATVPILAVDVHGLVNGWNLKIAELTGLPVASAIGKHLLSLVDESSTQTVERMLQLALAGREEQNVQFQMKTHGHGHGGRRDPVILVVNACASRDVQENVVGVCFVAQDVTSEKQVMDKFTRIEGDYRAIVRNPSPLIPPIFGTDEFGWCSEWNPAMTKLTGWEREDVIDRMLLGEVFGSNHAACCRLKNQEALVNLSVLVNNAMTGQAAEQVPFAFVSRRGGKHVACLLSVSKKLDSDGTNVTGVFCFLQIASNELQQVMHVQRLSEQSASKKLKALSYIRHEIRNPLSGILYTRQMLDGTELDSEQQRLLTTANKCHHLLNKILDDIDIESIMDSCLELEMTEFFLRDVLLTAISQVMIPSRSKGIRVVQDLDDDILNEQLYGDSLRLQQIIGDFLLISVKFSPCGTLVEVAGSLSKDRLGANLHVANLELKITHTAGSVPEDLLSQMFGAEEEASEEGISLLVCRKLLRLMNGDVRYVREAGKSSFIVSAELASANKTRGARMIIA